MKRNLFIITIFMISLSAASAQGTEVAENTSAKTQQQIMDNYNNRSSAVLKFYPNPAVNYLTVEPRLLSETGEIKIMDVTGRVKDEFHTEPGSNSMVIDVSAYNNGLYILALYDENNRLLNVNRFYKE